MCAKERVWHHQLAVALKPGRREYKVCPVCGREWPSHRNYCQACAVWMGGNGRSEELTWYGPAGEGNLLFRRRNLVPTVGEAAVAAFALCGREFEDSSRYLRFLAQAAEQLVDRGGIPVRGPNGNLTGCFFDPSLTTAATQAVHCALFYVREADKIGLRAFTAVNVGPVVAGSTGQKSNSCAFRGEVLRQAELLALGLQPRLVIIPPSVYQLVADRFDCYGACPLGLWGPLDELPGTLYVAQKEKAPTTWKHLLDGSNGPLFGRRQEMEELQRAWGNSRRRKGTLVHLSGSPGAGKSRLLQAFLSGVENETARPTVIKLAGANYGSSSGYLLGQLTEICTQLGIETAKMVKGRMESRLPGGRAERESLASRLMTELLQRQPLLIIIDDLHWCDPESLRLIAATIKDIPPGVMVVLSYRPSGSRQAAFFTGVQTLVLPLSPLEETEAKKIWVQEFGPGVNLPEALWPELWTMSAGNPLYIEEAAKLLAAGEAGPQTDILKEKVPDSLVALLLLRIRSWADQELRALPREIALGRKAGISRRLADIERQINDWLDRIETQRYFDRVEIAAFLTELEYFEARIREICLTAGVARPLTTRLGEALFRLYDESYRDSLKQFTLLARREGRGSAAGEQARQAAKRFAKRGKMREAAGFLNLAVKYYPPGYPGWADLLEDAGDARLLLGRPEKATPLYRAALGGTRTGEAERTSRLNLKLATCRLLQGEAVLPKPFAPRVSPVDVSGARPEGYKANDPYRDWLLVLSGAAALLAGRFEESVALARHASQRSTNRTVRTAAGLLAALAALAQGKPETALKDCTRAAADMRSGGPSLLSLALHWTMAQIHIRLESPPTFFRYHDRTSRYIARQLGVYPAITKHYGHTIVDIMSDTFPKKN